MAADHNLDLQLDRLPANLVGWANDAGWAALRPIQARCMDWFETDGHHARDLIVCAPTATGKTEAVFLPLIGAITEFAANGFEILYICPLKALIDQQAKRLRPLMKLADRTVTAWHGEATSGRAAARRRAEGMLVITPESLEKLLRMDEAQQMLGGLHAIVIDELHAFFGTPRGVQLISQLSRIEHLTGRTVARFGLSATLADDVEEQAKAFLRPADPARVAVIADDTPITAITFTVESYVDEAGEGLNSRTKILERLRETLGEQAAAKGSRLKALVFCNSRNQVEWCATELGGTEGLNKIVFPHHGSLKKAPRDEAEAALRDPNRSAIVISSPTLELGLDVGEIEQVVQLDPGTSVSSLRQRLGRSGRRAGKLSRMTMMIRETEASPDAHPLARLHLALMQALAQVKLVHGRRFEPPETGALNLSTFVQQSLSMCASGVSEVKIERQLLESGPFSEADRDTYRMLMKRLRRSADPDLPGIEPLMTINDETGVIELTAIGRDIVGRPDFGAAFSGGRQYVVRAGGEVLGHLPAGHNLRPGDPVFFAGRRWAVQLVSESPPGIILRPSGGGRPPRFAGSPIAPSGLVVRTMSDLYRKATRLPDCAMNELAEAQAAEAIAAFTELGLDERPSLVVETDVLLFPWQGSRVQATLISALRQRGLIATPTHIAITVLNTTVDQVNAVLTTIANVGLPAPEDMARSVKRPVIDKFDDRLGPFLQRRNYASARFDIAGARAAAESLVTP